MKIPARIKTKKMDSMQKTREKGFVFAGKEEGENWTDRDCGPSDRRAKHCKHPMFATIYLLTSNAAHNSFMHCPVVWLYVSKMTQLLIPCSPLTLHRPCPGPLRRPSPSSCAISACCSLTSSPIGPISLPVYFLAGSKPSASASRVSSGRSTISSRSGIPKGRKMYSSPHHHHHRLPDGVSFR